MQSKFKKIWKVYANPGLATPYPWALLVIVLLLASLLGDARSGLLLWSLFLFVQGAACWYSYRACGRAHCRIAGPGFILLGFFFVLTGLGVLPLVNLTPPFDLYTLLILAVLGIAFGYEAYIRLKTGSAYCVPPKASAEQAGSKLYQCPECKLHYKDKALANRCEEWCRQHHSCNIEIAKQSVELDKSHT